MIRYTVQLDPSDHVAAHRVHLRPRRRLRLALWLLGIPFFAVLAIDLYFGVTRDRAHPFLPLILGTGIFVVAWYFVLSPRQIRRSYQQSHDVGAAAPTLAGELTATGLVVTSEAVSGRLPWSDVTRWRRNDQIVLLYSAGDQFVMIPLRGFATDADRAAALALLEQQLGPAS